MFGVAGSRVFEKETRPAGRGQDGRTDRTPNIDHSGTVFRTYGLPVRPILLALAALPAGFAVAQWTGVRPLGGAVMALLGLSALLLGRLPMLATVAVAAVAAGAFAASHALAGTLGTWGAVTAAALAVGAAMAAAVTRSGSTSR